MHCRYNILLGGLHDVQRYQAVLHACALQHDVLHMSKGDLTTVGDRGSALSGGQRARLALARALYQVSCLNSHNDFPKEHLGFGRIGCRLCPPAQEPKLRPEGPQCDPNIGNR